MLTTVVGSYPRPERLIYAIRKYKKGKMKKEELEKEYEKALKEVIQEQAKAGLDILSDAQLRWDDIITPFASEIEGFELNGLIRFFDNNVYYRKPIVKKRVKWKGFITVENFKCAKKLSKKDIKAIITGPFTLSELSENRVYKKEKFLLDLANILHKEVKELERVGAKHIQIDEPALVNKKELKKDEVELEKTAISIITKGVKAKTFIYTYFNDVSNVYPDILDFDINGIGLDFISGKKNFELIKEYTFTKDIGVGCVDARNTKIETKGEIVKCIENVAQNVNKDINIFINPSCGLEFLPRISAIKKLVVMCKAKNYVEERYE